MSLDSSTSPPTLMPRRTNDFQSLMFLIQSQLAPTGAVVRESAPVSDESTGSDREIDIVISDPSGGGPPQRIAIECRDRSRKADVEWIDGLIGKYSSIRVRRVVAISRSGFTRNAIKKARAAAIDVLALSEALQADWETPVRTIVAALLRAHLVHRIKTELRFEDTPVPVPLEREPELLKATIQRADGSLLAPLGALVTWMFEGPEMQEKLAQGAGHATNEQPYVFCEFTYELPTGGYLLTSGGQCRPLTEVMVLARCRREDIRIVLEHKSLGRARVAFGTGETLGYRVHAAVSQIPEGPMKGGLLIRPPKLLRNAKKGRR